MLVQISLSQNIYESLTYNYAGDESAIEPGIRVIVPLANRVASGWIIKKTSEYQGKTKNIIGIIRDIYIPDTNYLNFARTISQLYFTSMGRILDQSLSPKRKSLNNIYFDWQGKVERLNKFSLKQLQDIAKQKPLDFFYHQKDGYQDKVEPKISGKANFIERKFLVGFDRIEYYKEIIDSFLKKGFSIIFIVPDNLTAEYWHTILDGADVFNSKVRLKEREKIWLDYLTGKTGVIIGGLSALFLPVKNLGYIICDRAGSFLFKRRYFTEFNINKLAKVRAEVFNINYCEGFSSLTSEAFQNRLENKVVVVDKREDKEVSVEVFRLTSRNKGIPQQVLEMIQANFHDNKKMLLILNRIYTSNFLFCPKCKNYQKCPVCQKALRVEDNFSTVCPKCHFSKENFKLCSKCHTELVLIEGMNIRNLKEVIKKRIVEKGVYTLTAESFADIKLIKKEIEKSRIVIATPVIFNPFFKNIFEIIIYIKPESVFNFNEYDAAELIFVNVSELLELVKKRGRINIFSNFHFHYALKLLVAENDFFNRELKYRQWFHLPPFANVYNIELKGRDLRVLAREMRKIYHDFKEDLNIKRIFLVSRKPLRGNYKGLLEVHCQADELLKTKLHKKDKLNIIVSVI